MQNINSSLFYAISSLFIVVFIFWLSLVFSNNLSEDAIKYRAAFFYFLLFLLFSFFLSFFLGYTALPLELFQSKKECQGLKTKLDQVQQHLNYFGSCFDVVPSDHVGCIYKKNNLAPLALSKYCFYVNDYCPENDVVGKYVSGVRIRFFQAASMLLSVYSEELDKICPSEYTRIHEFKEYNKKLQKVILYIVEVSKNGLI